MTGGSSLDAVGLKELVESLPGVLRAWIGTGDTGEVSAVRAMTSEEAGQGLLARKIRSLLMVQAGIDVPADAVEVTSVGNGSVCALWPSRLEIQSVQTSVQGKTRAVTVGLYHGGRVYEGRARSRGREPATWLAARATLEALRQTWAGFTLVELEDLQLAQVAGEQVVLTAVRLAHPGMDALLVGTSLVGPDPREAVVRATLNAVNRRFPEPAGECDGQVLLGGLPKTE